MVLESRPADVVRTGSLTSHLDNNGIFVGEWDDENLWYAMALQLLRFIGIVAWDKVLVDRKELHYAVALILEQHGDNYKDSGVG